MWSVGDYLLRILTLMNVNVLKLNKMDTIKFHRLVTRTGIVSLGALAAIGIISTLFGVCELDLSFLPAFFEMFFLFLLSSLAILVCFCFPVSYLMTLISIATSLKKNLKNEEE